MKVNNSGVKPTTAAQIQAKDLEKSLKSNKPEGLLAKTDTLGSSKVEMSSQAQAMQKAKAIASKDTIDEAKVARLQKLIDQGKYKVDAAAVADRLVDEQIATGE
jgi:negative regulator of flagellin synthesis FlgM